VLQIRPGTPGEAAEHRVVDAIAVVERVDIDLREPCLDRRDARGVGLRAGAARVRHLGVEA
jgi:hypothetical protein